MNVRAKKLHGTDPTASMPTNVTDGYEAKHLGFSEEDVKDPYDPSLPNDYVDVVRDRKEAWRNREIDLARNEKLKVGELVPHSIGAEEYVPFLFLLFPFYSNACMPPVCFVPLRKLSERERVCSENVMKLYVQFKPERQLQV